MATMHRRRLFGIAGGVDPANYYVPGNVDPAMSTSDYYHMLGAYGFRPYDLTRWGTPGNNIATATGYRYAWFLTADHPNLTQRWRDGAGFWLGFSNDPGVPPDPARLVSILPQTPSNGWPNPQPIPAAPNTGNIYQNTWIAYNPDDPNGLWFYLYGEGVIAITGSTLTHLGMLLRSADLLSWTPWGASHYTNNAPSTAASAAFHRVFRNGTGDWYSVGYAGKGGYSQYIALYTSTDGRTFTLDNAITGGKLINGTAPNTVITAHFSVTAGAGPVTLICTDVDLWTAGDVGKAINVAGAAPNGISAAFGTITSYNNPRSIVVTPYPGTNGVTGSQFGTTLTAAAVPVEWLTIIDRSPGAPGISNAIWGMTDDIVIGATTYQTMVEFTGAGGYYPAGNNPVADSMYISLVPIDPVTHQRGLAASFIRLTAEGEYVRSWPGPEYLMGVDSYAEDGILHVWPQRGYVTEVNLGGGGTHQGETLENGGSCKHQWRDYLTHVYNATLAASAAPVGVVASCAAGVVTVSWYDALPHQNYRVYQGNSAASQSTLVGTVSGLSTSFTPTPNAQVWIKVVTLNGGTEQQSRVVHCYASSASVFVNAHINRVIDDGGVFSTIDVTRISAIDSWLESRNLKKSLLHFVVPECGVKHTGGVVTKIYDLGSTYLPRGRNLWALTSNTTYSATAMDGRPAWTNSAGNAYLAFGGAGDPNGGTRFNQIRMKTQITVAALYQRTDTTVDCTFLGTSKSTSDGFDDDPVPNYNGDGPGLSLTHVAGTPGTLSFKMADQSGSKEATAAASGASVQVAIGTYDGSNMLAYSDAIAGSPNASYSQPTLRYDTVLNGARIGKSNNTGERKIPFLCSGSKEAIYNTNDNQYYVASGGFYPGFKPGTSFPPDRTFGQTNAKFRSGGLVVLGKGVTPTQAGELTALLMGEVVGESATSVVPLRMRVHA